MKAGITGFQYSGKTALFCALTGKDYESFSHSHDIHMGVVKVPDNRVDVLSKMFSPKKTTYATMEFFDIAGQTVGQERTIEPKALQTLKGADSLIIVTDAFGDDISPRKDYDRLMEEYAFNDLIIATNRLERLEKELKAGKKDELLAEKNVLTKCREVLEASGLIRDMDISAEEKKIMRGFQFLTQKPVVVIVNMSESNLTAGRAKEFESMFSDLKGIHCAAVCAEIEMEIAMLDETDRPGFLSSMGIDEPALGKMIKMSYESLGLISFFTCGPDEVRAWTVRKGSTAPECAGVIHSDLERGFIRAETVSYDDLISCGSMKDARDKGHLRIEGKEYIIKDGDIITVRFSV